MASGDILADQEGYRTAIGIVLEGMTTGARPFTDEQMARPIATVHAINQSLATGVAVGPQIAQALGG